ncbi:histidine kinase [Kribbella amoyensis]|uniref:histidine kinase n=1 Tax=Kribbella amoyensis TaxID=996641 RepID=A0A561B3G1_9ACTN|nr:histidine kinase [Kribbella amoyensis]
MLLASLLLVAGGEAPATLIAPVVISGLAIAVSVWAVIRSRRQRREYEERLTAWAGEQAAQAERLRIARDLHDLVSHGLGLITIRAAVARRAGADSATGLNAALTDIEQVSRGTTTELRRMLNVLRSENGESAPLRPAETLDDLPAIIDEARDAGLRVTADLPELDDVSPGAQLTVCAVVREALNNTLRHCGPTRAHLAVRREDGVLQSSYRDEGPVDGWTAHLGGGHGLTGLHERVTALGGTLEARPERGGFVVIARLPDGLAE